MDNVKDLTRSDFVTTTNENNDLLACNFPY